MLLLSAQGAKFDQAAARRLTSYSEILLICGRYEGVDERVAEHLADEELSIGDYVLSGGELAAAVVLDSVARLLPGVLGNEASAIQESFEAQRVWREPPDSPSNESRRTPFCASSLNDAGVLDCPHYSRPADFRGWKVPETLLNGNHAEIREWRRRAALAKTSKNRPDLLQ